MLILDCSVTMAWFFPDETSSYADSVLDHLREARAFVPALWPIEIANVLAVGERRHRTLPDQSDRFVTLLATLPIEIEQRPVGDLVPNLLTLARRHALSSSDAAYLDLAERLSLPLATLDARLVAAAGAAGVPLFGA